MAAIQIRLSGPFSAVLDGEPVRFRTQQQALLLARLAVDDAPYDRERAASLLWPSASRTNALAYLRRATMELRRLGLPVVVLEAGLALERSEVELQLAGAGEALAGIEHPLADEVRGLLRGHVREYDPERSEPDGPDLMIWMAQLMLEHAPRTVLRIVAENNYAHMHHFPPAATLPFFLKILEANPNPSQDRVRLLYDAARSAQDQTRYGQADRLFEQVVEESRAIGFEAYQSLALKDLAHGKIHQRRYGEARELLAEALVQAEACGHPGVLSNCHTAFGALQLGQLDFEGARESYTKARQLTTSDDQALVCSADLAKLEAGYGIEIDRSLLVALPEERPAGYIGAAEALLRFCLGVLYGVEAQVYDGVARGLEITSDLGLEAYFCQFLDLAAVALAKRGAQPDAAAVVRLGAMVRRDLGHRRTLGERFMLRRFVHPPFFGSAVREKVNSLRSAELATIAQRLTAQLHHG